MLKEFRQGLLFTLVTMLLFGVAYPGLVRGIARAAFPDRADGSLVRDEAGAVVGSRLLAQETSAARYFHPRPSAVDCNPASAGGSNYGPSNADHLAAVRERVDAFVRSERVRTEQVPSEMVTASGSGLDPHIPPAGAELQVARVASARRAAADEVRALVAQHTEEPFLGVFGRARVNVLELNLALDRAFGRARN